MVWTCELLDRVKILWAQGLTATEIGERVHKSRNAIIGKINRAKHNDEKIQARTKANKVKVEKKKLVAPAVPRGVMKGRGKQLVMPPSRAVASPPPLPLPLGKVNGWVGVVAEIHSLQSNQCRFPLGDPVTGFCRAPLNGNSLPYCDYHYIKALRHPDKRAGE
jgi:hypothetical protein